MEGTQLKPHQQRVVEEKNDLDSKIKNLQKFIETSDIFEELSNFEKIDLKSQLRIMEDYSVVLCRRINRF